MLVIPVVLAVSLAWYLPLLKRRAKTPTAAKKRYSVFSLLTVFVLGLVLAFVLNAMGEKLLANVLGLSKESPLYMLLNAFCVVGIAEELVKFLCGYVFVKWAKPTEKVDYMLIMGAAGVGFAMGEDIMYGFIGGVAMCLLRGAIPLHMALQLRMGAHLYEADQAKALNDIPGKRKAWVLALIVPMLFHGAYDFAAFLTAQVTQQLQAGTPVNAGNSAVVIVTCLFSLSTLAHIIATEVWAAKAVKATRQ